MKFLSIFLVGIIITSLLGLSNFDYAFADEKTIISETPITNPKSVQNWEFYNINTECQLKYLFSKDPNKKYEIIGVITQSSDRIEQEYFARGGERVEYGDRTALNESHDLIREITSEIIMEKYSINPILKDKVSDFSNNEISNDESRQIQQGTHVCEDEFRLYSDDYENDPLTVTKTPFTDSPVNGIEVGQWVKLKMEFINSSDEFTKQTMDNQLSEIFGGVNFKLSDIEEVKYEVVDITDNEITMNNELKITGKSGLFKTTSTYTFPKYSYFLGFIPTNVKQGNIIPSELNYIELSVIDFPKKEYGGKQTETIHIGGSFEQQFPDSYVKHNVDSFYHKKTGMLLESNTNLELSTPTSRMDVNFKTEVIDYYIPSESSIFNISSEKSRNFKT